MAPILLIIKPVFHIMTHNVKYIRIQKHNDLNVYPIKADFSDILPN